MAQLWLADLKVLVRVVRVRSLGGCLCACLGAGVACVIRSVGIAVLWTCGSPAAGEDGYGFGDLAGGYGFFISVRLGD